MEQTSKGGVMGDKQEDKAMTGVLISVAEWRSLKLLIEYSCWLFLWLNVFYPIFSTLIKLIYFSFTAERETVTIRL